MAGQPSDWQPAGLLCGPAGANSDQYDARMEWLSTKIFLKVNDLQGAIPYHSRKAATPEQLQLQKKVTRTQITSIIKELEEIMLVYNAEETDREEADKVCEFGDGVILETYEWIDSMEEAYSKMRVKEILIIDSIQKVKPLTEGDSRCIYEFIKEVTPLENLLEKEAVEILTEELLSLQLQRLR